MIEKNQKGDYDPIAKTEGIEMEPARGKDLGVEKDKNDAKGDDKKDQKSKPKDPADKPVAFYKLFRFADRLDYFLMFFGFLASMINGTALPLFSLVFGSMSDEFNQGKDALLDAVSRLALYLFLIGLGTFFLSAISQSFWMISGERQSIRYRYNYFQAVLNQNVGWYDSINPNELAAKIANETFKVQGAIGEKVATFVMTIFIFIAGFAIGFAKGWQLSLVIAASLPVITLSAFFFVYVIQNITTKSSEGYSTAGANAEQALSGIKTVKALVGEVKLKS